MKNDGTFDLSRFNSPLLTRYSATADLHQVLPLEGDEHVVIVRKHVREHALELKLSLVDQTKLVTAASELARNTLKYGGGGVVVLERLRDGFRNGLRLVFADTGPGIVDIEQALRDGFTSGGGLGLGLGGTKRLVDDFVIDSRPQEGTAVAIIKWKN
nr:anti-sigma regulatory factor [uncultured Duganella sp.]